MVSAATICSLGYISVQEATAAAADLGQTAAPEEAVVASAAPAEALVASDQSATATATATAKLEQAATTCAKPEEKTGTTIAIHFGSAGRPPHIAYGDIPLGNYTVTGLSSGSYLTIYTLALDSPSRVASVTNGETASFRFASNKKYLFNQHPQKAQPIVYLTKQP